MSTVKTAPTLGAYCPVAKTPITNDTPAVKPTPGDSVNLSPKATVATVPKNGCEREREMVKGLPMPLRIGYWGTQGAFMGATGTFIGGFPIAVVVAILTQGIGSGNPWASLFKWAFRMGLVGGGVGLVAGVIKELRGK